PGLEDHRAGGGEAPAAPAAPGAPWPRRPRFSLEGGRRAGSGAVTEHSNGTPDENEDAAAIAGRERMSEQVVRTGMFGTHTTGDTSGYGGLRVRKQPALSSERPYGSYFDEVADALGGALQASELSFGDAVER